MVEISEYELWILCIDSLRYSMGRMSTAPSFTSDFIRRMFRHLDRPQIEQLRKEVEVELALAARDGGYLGMKMDDDTWRQFVADCTMELEKRHDN